MTRDMRTRVWGGDGWYVQEEVVVPGTMTLSGLPAFAQEHGIPAGALFGAEARYEDESPEVTLTWLVRES